MKKLIFFLIIFSSIKMLGIVYQGGIFTTQLDIPCTNEDAKIKCQQWANDKPWNKQYNIGFLYPEKSRCVNGKLECTHYEYEY